MKRLICMIISIIMLLSLAVGCGGNQDKTTSPGSSEKDSPASQKADGREMNGNIYTTGLPIVKEKESFKLLVCADADPNQMQIFKDLEERTNVKVEWEAYPYSVAVEKKNLMYASGDYPDALGGWLLGSNDIVTYSAQGIYIPVEDYIKKYAPNIQKAIDNFPNAKQTLTAPDGHIYTFALMGPQNLSSWIMHINKSWLDRLGLEMPTTTDELVTVLEAFKTQDPNGNQKADEVPMSFRKGIYSGFFGAFGRVDPSGHKVVENGKVVYTAMHDEYKNAIKYLNSLYGKQLIDQEAFTHDAVQYQAKGKEEDSLYGVFFDFTGVNVVGLEKYQDEYVPLPPLKGPDGKTSWIEGDKWIFRNQFAITSEAKNPEVIVRWLDCLYEPDMSYQIMMGPFGIATEKTADGKLRFLDPPEGKTESEIRNETTISGLPYCIMPEYHKNIEKNIFAEIKDEMNQVYAPYIIKEKYPQVWITPEENEELAVMSSDIEKFVDDMQAQWIVGQRSVDDDWDEYLENLKKMNIDRYIQIHQQTVDRSLSIK